MFSIQRFTRHVQYSEGNYTCSVFRGYLDIFSIQRFTRHIQYSEINQTCSVFRGKLDMFSIQRLTRHVQYSEINQTCSVFRGKLDMFSIQREARHVQFMPEVLNLWILVKSDGQILFMKSLFTEIKKLQFSSKILPDDIFCCFLNLRLIQVPVYFREYVNFI